MKICMILEGSYPYVRGGVSSWMHNYIRAWPQHEFILWVVGAHEKDRGKFKYEIPDNVTEIHEVFLDSALELRAESTRKLIFSKTETEQIETLFWCGDPDWEVLFSSFNERKVNPVAFLMSEQFLQILEKLAREQYPYIAFAELFHATRSMMLPLMYLLSQNVPQADIYHATATGYSGVLGALASWKYKRPYVVTEHGIYSREREEELIRAKWVASYFKKQWIELFYMMSRCAYTHADVVTSLFERAMETQIELGCAPEKCVVVRNGIETASFYHIPLKEPDGFIDIGAVVRLAPIKDIKTMIYGFAELSSRMDAVRLHIMGDTDDPEYGRECRQLVRQLKVNHVFFTGSVDVREYMKKIDFTILTSISEGQPLSVIESMCAGRPCVTTDVGCCRELLAGGTGDLYGPAGICVPPMHREELADAMEIMAGSQEKRLSMGAAGRERVITSYTHAHMMEGYSKAYERAITDGGYRI